MSVSTLHKKGTVKKGPCKERLQLQQLHQRLREDRGVENGPGGLEGNAGRGNMAEFRRDCAANTPSVGVDWKRHLFLSRMPNPHWP